MITENDVLDFDDLDALLGEAKQNQQTILDGKSASRRLLRGNIHPADKEDLLKTIHAAEAIHTWQDVADIAVTHIATCWGCGQITSTFLGYFILQRHMREKGSKKILKLTKPREGKALYEHRASGETEVCAHCVAGDNLPSDIASEFTILANFSTTKV